MSAAALFMTLATLAVPAPATRSAPPSWAERLQREEAVLHDATASREDRFHALIGGAKAAFEVGDFEKAERYARRLLAAAEQYRKSWDYGDAWHDGHMVLGRVALARGDQPTARIELIEAGKTPGSALLARYGPNVSLAEDLLRGGERATVLAYLEQCKGFWETGSVILGDWIRLVESGKPPDFGANLDF